MYLKEKCKGWNRRETEKGPGNNTNGVWEIDTVTKLKSGTNKLSNKD